MLGTGENQEKLSSFFSSVHLFEVTKLPTSERQTLSLIHGFSTFNHRRTQTSLFHESFLGKGESSRKVSSQERYHSGTHRSGKRRFISKRKQGFQKDQKVVTKLLLNHFPGKTNYQIATWNSPRLPTTGVGCLTRHGVGLIEPPSTSVNKLIRC